MWERARQVCVYRGEGRGCTGVGKSKAGVCVCVQGVGCIGWGGAALGDIECMSSGIIHRLRIVISSVDLVSRQASAKIKPCVICLVISGNTDQVCMYTRIHEKSMHTTQSACAAGLWCTSGVWSQRIDGIVSGPVV